MQTALPYYLRVPGNWQARGPQGGQAGGKDGTGKGKGGGTGGGKGGEKGKSAGAFSDAGYGNKSATGYKAGAQVGGLGGFSGFGGTKKAGNSTVADMMIAEGKIVAPSIGPNGMAQGNYPSKTDAYNDYASAVGDYATRGLLGKIADFVGGSWIDQQEPISQNPRTFAQGTYHTSTNPGGAISGLLGGMVNPAVGALAGKVGGWGYNALGGKNIFHGGYDQPDTGEYSDPSGGWGQASGGGLFGGGGGPSSPQANRGAEGLLTASQPGVSPQAPVTPAAQPAVQQAQERKKRMYALNGVNIPGPTPYSFTGAKWL